MPTLAHSIKGGGTKKKKTPSFCYLQGNKSGTRSRVLLLITCTSALCPNVCEYLHEVKELKLDNTDFSVIYMCLFSSAFMGKIYASLVP